MKIWTDIVRETNAQILEWAEAQSWSRDMATCNQDAQWHAEGDVWTHTKMVCAELEQLGDWPSLNRAAQLKLLFTALFHDSGKPATTAFDPETGRTRSPKHALVGAEIARHLEAEVLLDLENHHNFAWKEKHVIDGVEREVIVHRKGATPAGTGVLGIIPGSMAAPGFVVSGKGNAESLNSASHGAGRAMSRKAANEKFNWKDVNRFLKQQGVTLISAGLDEVPMAYKNIRDVMSAQKDLVTVLGEFMPKLVKMAPSGERPED